MLSRHYITAKKSHTIFIYKERVCPICKKTFRQIDNHSHACQGKNPHVIKSTCNIL